MTVAICAARVGCSPAACVARLSGYQKQDYAVLNDLWNSCCCAWQGNGNDGGRPGGRPGLSKKKRKHERLGGRCFEKKKQSGIEVVLGYLCGHLLDSDDKSGDDVEKRRAKLWMTTGRQPQTVRRR